MKFLVLTPASSRQQDPSIPQLLVPALKQVGKVTIARDWVSFINYSHVEEFTGIFISSAAYGGRFHDWQKELGRIRMHQSFVLCQSGATIEVEAAADLTRLFTILRMNSLEADLPGIVERLQTYRMLRKDVGNKIPKGYLRPSGMGAFVGNSLEMLQIYRQIIRVAGSEYTVLIRGASGVGKDLVARTIHELSSRSQAGYVSINCAAIPENLLESELFGYEKGAFTGATQPKAGKFEMADRGTLFLDEIGDMPISLQAKLLRVLEDQTIQPLGSVRERRIDIRLLAATHQDLDRLIEAGEFREDLHYRLNVIAIDVPDLAHRQTDIPLLALHFMHKLLGEGDRSIQHMEWPVLQELEQSTIGGNVRELENVLTRTLFMTEGHTVRMETLQDILAQRQGRSPEAGAGHLEESFQPHSLKEMEQELIGKTLAHLEGNISQAAQVLGISRPALYRKIKNYGFTEFMSQTLSEEKDD